jgi:hypothetical protein
METSSIPEDDKVTIIAINDVERPTKIQRLKEEDTNAFIEEHKSSTLNIYEYDIDGSSCRDNHVIWKHLDRLQMLIQHFHQSVTPYTYNNPTAETTITTTDDTTTATTTTTTTNIDQLAIECTKVIKLLDWTHVYHIDGTMTILHQLHGTLLLWLSYIITSHIPWDVTNMDCFQVHQMLMTTTNHICTCLLEIYRISPHICNVPLPSIESFLILYKALRFLTKPIDRSKATTGYKSMALLSTLFEVIDSTLHQVDCIRGLSSYEFQQFILCLVQASLINVDITSSITTNTMARQILEGLQLSIEESDSLFAKLVQVATNVVSNPNVALIEQSGTSETLSTLQLFHILCLLHVPNKQPLASTTVDVLRLFQKSMTTSIDYAQCGIPLILDCIVTITSSQYTFESENKEETMYGIISDILVDVLIVSEINTATYVLKAKAIEALQNLFELNLSSYVMDESRYEDRTMQCMVTSIFNMCIQSQDSTLHQNENDNTSGVDGENEANQSWNSLMEDPVLGAAEILLAILSHVINEYDDSAYRLPVPYVMSMCSHLLNHFSSVTNPPHVSSIHYPKRNQHIQYLIIHMIGQNIETLGLYMHTYPVLALAMADVLMIDYYDCSYLNDPQVVMTMQRTILNAFKHLLQANRSIYQSILGRDGDITGAILSVVVDGNDTAITKEGERNQEIAIELLCILSEDVLNRSMMARQANLLSGLIRYLRCMDIDDTSTATAMQRDRLKQCIQQLSAVL